MSGRSNLAGTRNSSVGSPHEGLIRQPIAQYSEIGNPLPPHGLNFPISSKGSFICTIPDRIAHTTAFVTPVVGHWLEREIHCTMSERSYHGATCHSRSGHVRVFNVHIQSKLLWCMPVMGTGTSLRRFLCPGQDRQTMVNPCHKYKLNNDVSLTPWSTDIHRRVTSLHC